MKVPVILITSLVSLSLAPFPASADTVTLKADSMTGFVEAEGWSNGRAPEPGNDYVVADGCFLHGDRSQGFAGDSLQFGYVGGTEGVFFKEHAGTHEFAKLILANGFYRTWMSYDTDVAHIAGTAVVLSPETTPFRIYGTHDEGGTTWTTFWDATLTGAAGTGLLVGVHPNATEAPPLIVFTGDNSAYLGSIRVNGLNTTFAITSEHALGGALDSVKYDALVLSDNATFEGRMTDGTLAASLNRGLTVESSGGRIRVGSGDTFRIEWPISGEGVLTKTGVGTLALAGALNPADAGAAAVRVEVAEGRLLFADGFSNASGKPIAVKAGSAVTVASGEEVRVNSLVFDGGAIAITCDANGENVSGTLVLGEGCAPNWPIPVYPPAVRGVKAAFLKVPVSAGTITAESFAKPDDLAATGLPSAKITVETDGDWQTAYAESVPLVSVVDDWEYKAYLIYNSEAWRWSDGQIPHADADYEVRGIDGHSRTLYSTGYDDPATECVLPCSSILFAGASGARGVFSFGMSVFTADIRTGDYSQILPEPTTVGEQHLCGRLHVGNSPWTTDFYLNWRTSKDGLLVVVDSTVSGSGGMSFQPAAPDVSSTYYFTGDNTFNGNIFVWGTSGLTTLKFAKPSSFGTNPETPIWRSFLIQDCGELYPVGSQRVVLPNREFSFYGTQNQYVRVDAGETFELVAPLEMPKGSVTAKVGGGTWAVEGTMRISDDYSSEAPSLFVREGFIRPDSPRVFSDVAVTVAEGAGIAAKYRPYEATEVAAYGMIVTDAAKFAVSGDTLSFKVVTGGERLRGGGRIPVLTVPESVAESVDTKTIRLVHDVTDENAAMCVVREEVSIDGVPFIRYSARCDRGLLLFVR